jgi:hypothetical protein
MCVISGFHSKVDEICTHLGYYEVSSSTGFTITHMSTVLITDVLQFCQ